MSTRGLVAVSVVLLVSLVASACDQVEAVGVDPHFDGDPILGKAAFEAECSACHASRDGLDLARFSFADSTIVRRALGHVDSATASNIVAHVRTILIEPETETTPVFQPGGRVLSGDVEFAEEVFGFDGFPGGMTTERLQAIDVRDVAVAIRFPVWSVEGANLDWMPETGLPPGVLSYSANWAQKALDAYYEDPTVDNLATATARLRSADRTSKNSDAPCRMSPVSLLEPDECFQTRRWIATLGAQHMMRNRTSEPVHVSVHDAWWDVGHAVRTALLRDQAFENGVENWTSWMWLGWSYAPSRHASIYLSSGLQRMGYYRHATFHALRAMVERVADDHQSYSDVRTAAIYAPAHWTYESVAFGYRHLLERLEAGEQPKPSRLKTALAHVRDAHTYAARRVTAGEAAALAMLRDQVLEGLS